MARVKLSDEQAQALRERPVAKGKGSVKARAADKELETDVKVIRTKKAAENAKPELHAVDAASLRSVVEESMARCYGEIFPAYSTHDEEERVILDISEEAYVLVLTMVVGNDIDTPRQGLKIREDSKVSANMKPCKECSDD